jgi:NAD(P)-dependent dehydrogenase (short-subunit alcohol dehydrogenase family)
MDDGITRGRRAFLAGGAFVAAGGLAAAAAGQVPANPRSAGPIVAGRDCSLAGKSAFVSGAARGIGRAIAVVLTANGADVMIFDIAGYVSPASNAKPATPADLAETSDRSRRLAANASRQRATPVTFLRSGRWRPRWNRPLARPTSSSPTPRSSGGSLLEMEDSDWKDVIDVNLNGTANQIRASAPHMVARKSDAIILLSSMEGKHGTSGASSYPASKHDIIGLMNSAAMEFGRHGVTVNAILPGLGRHGADTIS